MLLLLVNIPLLTPPHPSSCTLETYSEVNKNEMLYSFLYLFYYVEFQWSPVNHHFFICETVEDCRGIKLEFKVVCIMTQCRIQHALPPCRIHPFFSTINFSGFSTWLFLQLFKSISMTPKLNLMSISSKSILAL